MQNEKIYMELAWHDKLNAVPSGGDFSTTFTVILSR
jgi:hypothetical protein